MRVNSVFGATVKSLKNRLEKKLRNTLLLSIKNLIYYLFYLTKSSFHSSIKIYALFPVVGKP